MRVEDVGETEGELLNSVVGAGETVVSIVCDIEGLRVEEKRLVDNDKSEIEGFVDDVALGGCTR